MLHVVDAYSSLRELYHKSLLYCGNRSRIIYMNIHMFVMRTPSLCITPCSRGVDSFLRWSHVDLWGLVSLLKVSLSLSPDPILKDPFCSPGPEFILKKPLEVLVPFSRRTLPLEVLTLSLRHPHLQGANSLLQDDYNFDDSFYPRGTSSPLWETLSLEFMFSFSRRVLNT